MVRLGASKTSISGVEIFSDCVISSSLPSFTNLQQITVSYVRYDIQICILKSSVSDAILDKKVVRFGSGFNICTYFLVYNHGNTQDTNVFDKASVIKIMPTHV